MTFDATRWAKEFAATHTVKPSSKQHEAFVVALKRMLNDAYNIGYRKGHDAAEYDDTR